MADELEEGELIIQPARSGGTFDPMGRHIQHVWRADDVKAIVKSHANGRWVFITLTVDRTLFLSPESAYQRCNERVRKVMSDVAPDGVWFCGFEVQIKTGDGWPHWHVLAWLDPRDHRTVEQLHAAVMARWRTKTEHVDRETGELTHSCESIASPKGVCVEEAKDRQGVGTYVAKYMTKRWSAVPEWMLVSSKRFRKLRLSNGAYRVLERLHRHVPAVGGRKLVGPGPRRVTRPMLQRLADSGSSLNVFQKVRGSLKFVRSLPLPCEEMPRLVAGGCEVLRLGAWSKVRLKTSESRLRNVVEGIGVNEMWRLRIKYREKRQRELLDDWHRLQWSGSDRAERELLSTVVC